MTQYATVLTRTGSVEITLPPAEAALLEGVPWGAIEAFPTPAYWSHQVIARRLLSRPANYKLGRTLAEEVTACLLGGYGIPASVGMAAFERLRTIGALTGAPPSEEEFKAILSEPLQIGQRQVRYRFPAQKARYLASSLPAIRTAPAFTAGNDLRNWLVQLPGIGLKTASWIARNWMDADDVAILDVHIMRVGQAIRLFPRDLTVERHYLRLEALFLNFCRKLDVRPSELDAVIWYEMASSPKIARVIKDHLRNVPPKTDPRNLSGKRRPAETMVR